MFRLLCLGCCVQVTSQITGSSIQLFLTEVGDQTSFGEGKLQFRNFTEVQQTCPVLFRRAPIARSGTQVPFGHFSLASGANSGLMWSSGPVIWQLEHRPRENEALLNFIMFAFAFAMTIFFYLSHLFSGISISICNWKLVGTKGHTKSL